jgi:hypothetical protein
LHRQQAHLPKSGPIRPLRRHFTPGHNHQSSRFSAVADLPCPRFGGCILGCRILYRPQPNQGSR